MVLHPDHAGRAKEHLEKFKKIVEGLGGVVTRVEEWGMREMAYRIQKQARGYYALLQYNSSPQAVDELGRNLKLSDEVLRFLSVQVGEGSPPATASADKGRGRHTQRAPAGEPAKADAQT